MDEPAEDAKADTDASDVGDYEHYCIAVAFEFVHGFGFSWLKKIVRWRAAPLGWLVSVLGIANFFCGVHFFVN